MTANSRWMDIATDAGNFKGYLSLPPAGKGMGIVLIEEIFGVNSHIRGVADQYAQDGYVVLAPDVFWRIQPGVELGYEGADREKAMAQLQNTDVPTAVGDIGATVKALRALPEVTGKIAAIGYCFGGRLTFLSAAAGSIDAAVAYYGGGIHNLLGEADKIQAPIQFHFAANDSSIPLSAVDQVKARFAGRDNAEVHIYAGAGHGFNCWDRSAYHPHSAALAHGRTLIFLGAHL